MSVPRATDGVAVRFTNRGDAVLDELATVLTAHCSRTPEGIARVLDEVMHASAGRLGRGARRDCGCGAPPRGRAGTVPGDQPQPKR